METCGRFGRAGVIFCALFLVMVSDARGHRSGCHRWHSCPSDSGGYVCGDTGHCGYCPDNRYCANGSPIGEAQPQGASAESQGAASETRGTSGASGYARSLYRHWTDDDNDCQNTRHEVLLAENRGEARLSPDGCKIISGRWVDPYSARVFTDPRMLDVDHFIPLAEAHRSGASAWDRERRQRFANDILNEDTLMAVYQGENRAKGDKDPSEWMPSNKEYHCEYLRVWIQTKQTWELSMDAKERDAIDTMLANCD